MAGFPSMVGNTAYAWLGVVPPMTGLPPYLFWDPSAMTPPLDLTDPPQIDLPNGNKAWQTSTSTMTMLRTGSVGPFPPTGFFNPFLSSTAGYQAFITGQSVPGSVGVGSTRLQLGPIYNAIPPLPLESTESSSASG
jgi:hypothetical protein